MVAAAALGAPPAFPDSPSLDRAIRRGESLERAAAKACPPDVAAAWAEDYQPPASRFNDVDPPPRQQPERVKIDDIVSHTRLSRPTVVLALAGKDRHKDYRPIRPETRDRVLSAAQELGLRGSQCQRCWDSPGALNTLCESCPSPPSRSRKRSRRALLSSS